MERQGSRGIRPNAPDDVVGGLYRRSGRRGECDQRRGGVEKGGSQRDTQQDDTTKQASKREGTYHKQKEQTQQRKKEHLHAKNHTDSDTNPGTN